MICSTGDTEKSRDASETGDATSGIDGRTVGVKSAWEVDHDLPITAQWCGQSEGELYSPGTRSGTFVASRYGHIRNTARGSSY